VIAIGSGVLRARDEVGVLETQNRFIPNDRTAAVAEGDLPTSPGHL
jgi:hypothetical protein